MAAEHVAAPRKKKACARGPPPQMRGHSLGRRLTLKTDHSADMFQLFLIEESNPACARLPLRRTLAHYRPDVTKMCCQSQPVVNLRCSLKRGLPAGWICSQRTAALTRSRHASASTKVMEKLTTSLGERAHAMLTPPTRSLVGGGGKPAWTTFAWLAQPWLTRPLAGEHKLSWMGPATTGSSPVQ